MAIDAGHRSAAIEAFDMLREQEAIFVRRALITGLNCAARAAGAEGDAALKRRALAAAEALEPDAAEIEPLLGWLARECGIEAHAARTPPARGVGSVTGTARRLKGRL